MLSLHYPSSLVMKTLLNLYEYDGQISINSEKYTMIGLIVSGILWLISRVTYYWSSRWYFVMPIRRKLSFEEFIFPGTLFSSNQRSATLKEFRVKQAQSNSTCPHDVLDRSNRGIRRYPISISHKANLPDLMINDLKRMIQGYYVHPNILAHWNLAMRDIKSNVLCNELDTDEVARTIWKLVIVLYNAIYPDDDCKLKPGIETKDGHVKTDLHVQTSSEKFIISLELKNPTVGKFHMPKMVAESNNPNCAFETPLPQTYTNHLSIIAKVFSSLP
jgi:hypothetical protein